MAETKKTLAQWEDELALYSRNGEPTDVSKYTKEEFEQLAEQQNFIRVDKEYRLNFLEENGYEVNRANMIDISLVIKPKAQEEES